ncbi:MAG: FAD-dependent oxidoreductase [Burkholderiaceae bacterium]
MPSHPLRTSALTDGRSDQTFRVAVVGAGWSGLACAEALSTPALAGGAVRGGRLAVTVIEAAPQAGGRARGLSWLPEGWADHEALPIDNGQHLVIGAYSATRDLLRRVGIPNEAWQQFPLHWAVPGPVRASSPQPSPDPGLVLSLVNQQAHQSSHYESPGRLLIVPSDGGLKRLLRSALPQALPAGYAKWPLAWRFSLAKTLARGWFADWSAEGTAEAWWKQQSVPSDLLQYFWKPVVEGALNTPFSSASARVALQVLKDSLLGPAHASDTLHPLLSLTAQAVAPITQALGQRGVQMVYGCRLIGITTVPRNAADSSNALDSAIAADIAHPSRTNGAPGWRLEFHPTSQARAADSGLTEARFDAVVLALPAQVCRTLAFDLSGHRSSSGMGRHGDDRVGNESGDKASGGVAIDGFNQEKTRWNAVRGLGVTTLYAALRPDQAAQAGLSPEVLRPVGAGGVAMVLARPAGPHGQVIAAVASATERQTEDQTQDLLRAAMGQVLSPRLGQDALANIPLRTTHDYQATWACTADHVDGGSAWGPSALGPAGLYRAGDDLTPGYPACIESAVRGGIQTAQAVIAQARIP